MEVFVEFQEKLPLTAMRFAFLFHFGFLTQDTASTSFGVADCESNPIQNGHVATHRVLVFGVEHVTTRD